jgi:methylmalonyl-CoA mutase C-terminal domain/subunit
VERPYRVVVAKPGFDGHDREPEVLARALRDAGFEVIFTGSSSTPEQVAEVALQEDADAIGLSVLADAHVALFPRMVDELTARGLDDVVVFGGGDVPSADLAVGHAPGVEIFTPGASMASITEWLAEALDAREAASDKEG